MPPIPGLDSVPAMTEVELLALNELPEHLVIIGGGYIGCEFGQMFRRFGSEVTMITTSRIAPREYEDVSEIITDMLTADGVQLRTGRTTRVGRHGDGVEVELDDGTVITGSHLLVAVGRTANSDLLGDHGIAVDERGFFVIDGRFQTSVKGVWALGDINGHGAFTHTAYQDSQILLEPPRIGRRSGADLCDVHRSAAGPGGDERTRRPRVGPQRAQGRGADEPRHPGGAGG